MKTYTFRRLLLPLAMIAVFLAHSCSNKIKKPEHYELILVETSDVHGAIFDYDFINDKPSSGSLSKVYSYVKELRENRNVILMDNGDILQGQPVVYYSNYEKPNSEHICSRVMNYMQYDVATIGNHDIEAGHLVYDKLRKEFEFPWLAANAVNTETGNPYFEPYTIIYKDGFKIAILGLITPGIPDWLPKELWEGIEFEDMVVAAKKWVPAILEKENPDLMVGLFHAGYDYTYGNNDENTYKNENASALVAKNVPGIDVIFIGHDHRAWNEVVENINGEEVLILGPTASARQVATASIKFSKDEDGTYNKLIAGDIVKMEAYKADKSFNTEFEAEFNEVKDYVSKQVGFLNENLYTHEALYGPSKFMDLIHEFQLEQSGASISIAAPLSFNAIINKGPLYVRDMFKLYRYENFLYTIELTGKEIDNFLEYSFANWFNTMKGPDDNLLLFKKDENGELIFSERNNSYQLENRFYNFDVASGINYKVDITKPINEKVSILSFTDQSEFHLDSTYVVALNSYRGNGGGGHLTKGVGLSKKDLVNRRVNSTDKDVRYFLMKWIEAKDTLKIESKNEWVVIPEVWWDIARKKDKELLNRK